MYKRDSWYILWELYMYVMYGPFLNSLRGKTCTMNSNTIMVVTHFTFIGGFNDFFPAATSGKRWLFVLLPLAFQLMIVCVWIVHKGTSR